MRDRTGVAPQASRLLACRKGGCVTARDKPPSCLRQGREFRFYTWEETRGRKGMACVSARLTAGKSCPLFKLVAGEASPAPPGRGQSPLPSPLKGALPPRPPKGGRYPPYPPLTGRVRDRTGQAALLPAARAGGCTPGEPPSCVPQGRKASYCSQAEPREREETTHARATASGPKREAKFFRPFEKRPQQGSNAGAEGIYPHQGPPP